MTQVSRIALTGGTGFLGAAIRREAHARGYHTILLTRRPGEVEAAADETLVDWSRPDEASLAGATAVMNLAGENLGAYWSADKKRKILESRREGTRALVDAIGRTPEGERPSVLVSASAVGYYADRGEETLTESSAPGSGFLVDVCKVWEEEALRAEQFGLRVALVRIGVVLGPGGGAMARFLPPFKMGVGGPLGNGRQWFPWVHIDDVAGIFLFAVENDSVNGPVNAVAPGIVRGSQFARSLGQALHRPAFLPTPIFALKLLLGDFAEHLVESQHVVPERALEAGYGFRHPNLDEALPTVVS